MLKCLKGLALLKARLNYGRQALATKQDITIRMGTMLAASITILTAIQKLIH